MSFWRQNIWSNRNGNKDRNYFLSVHDVTVRNLIRLSGYMYWPPFTCRFFCSLSNLWNAACHLTGNGNMILAFDHLNKMVQFVYFIKSEWKQRKTLFFLSVHDVTLGNLVRLPGYRYWPPFCAPILRQPQLSLKCRMSFNVKQKCDISLWPLE